MGATGAICAAVVDPEHFNIVGKLKPLIEFSLFCGGYRLIEFLHDHPLPDDPPAPVPPAVKISIILLFCMLFVGCVPSTTFCFSKTDPATGCVSQIKVVAEKELTADDFAVNFDEKKGTASLTAKHLESRSVNVITADTAHVEAIGTAGGNVIKGLGAAAGEAGAMIIGTEGLNAATQGIGQLLGTKMTMDAMQQAAAAKAAAQAAGGVK